MNLSRWTDVIWEILFLENDTNVFQNIPVGFPLTILLGEFSETRILFFISFCLWEDLSINDFFFFTNASCKLPGIGVNLGMVPVKRNLKLLSSHWNFLRQQYARLWDSYFPPIPPRKVEAVNLSRELPWAPEFTNHFRCSGHTCWCCSWLLHRMLWIIWGFCFWYKRQKFTHLITKKS